MSAVGLRGGHEMAPCIRIGKTVRSGSHQRGFTYIGLLLIIALSGIVLAGAGVVWSTTLQREKEEELLVIGQEVRTAIAQYYLRTPGTVKRYPPNLEALLFDFRQAALTRHLRKIYRDPVTGNAEWGLIASPDGGVMGIYSLSDRVPIKTNFDGKNLDFSGSKKYSDWHFQYVPQISISSKR